MGILFTILMGFLFTITLGILFTIVLGIQFTISMKLLIGMKINRYVAGNMGILLQDLGIC